VNCSVAAISIKEVAGATAIDTNVGGTGLTVKVAVPETPLGDVAVIVTVPAATPVARPLDPMVAMVGSDEVQVTVDVKSRKLSSL
jgi:hypothetical protein